MLCTNCYWEKFEYQLVLITRYAMLLATNSVH